MHFAVIIPSYNNEKHVFDNLHSLATQRYPFWTAIYIDDCSTDQTGQIVEEYVQKHKLEHKIKIWHNEKNVGAMANFYRWIHTIKPTDIVVHLDGDDRLAHEGVLDTLAGVYADKNVWVTYGSYRPEPADYSRVCGPFPDWVLRSNTFRKYGWTSSHLKTYYAKLFHNIKIEDLMYKGQFVPVGSDLAFMFCILEQASEGHIHYISDELYIYNYLTPLNDMKKDRSLVLEVDKYIREQKCYTPLKTLF